jgi:outer membrane lipoprotein-sorting protein
MIRRFLATLPKGSSRAWPAYRQPELTALPSFDRLTILTIDVLFSRSPLPSVEVLAPAWVILESSVTEKFRPLIRISPFPLRMTRRALLGALVLAPFTALAAEVAQPADAPMNLSEDDRADLKRISIYLDGIHTMRARFSQVASGGALSSGTIYLRRPGQMRVEYEPPVPVLLVADGYWVDYYDTKLGQLTQIPISQTPIWFLLQETIKFTPATTVTRIERSPGALRVSLYQTEHPDAGSASLTFADDPLQLKQWTIKDSQGNQIEIALHGAVFGEALPNDLFVTPRIHRPQHGQRIVP